MYACMRDLTAPIRLVAHSRLPASGSLSSTRLAVDDRALLGIVLGIAALGKLLRVELVSKHCFCFRYRWGPRCGTEQTYLGLLEGAQL